MSVTVAELFPTYVFTILFFVCNNFKQFKKLSKQFKKLSKQFKKLSKQFEKLSKKKLCREKKKLCRENRKLCRENKKLCRENRKLCRENVCFQNCLFFLKLFVFLKLFKKTEKLFNLSKINRQISSLIDWLLFD